MTTDPTPLASPSPSLPPPEPAPVEPDRAEQFPAIEESPTGSLWMLATQFFIAPMVIALAAVCMFVLASLVVSREPRGCSDLLVRIRDGGRNERTQAAFDLAQFLNAHKDQVSQQDRAELLRLFDLKLQRHLDPATSLSEEDLTIVRFLALCLGLVGDPSFAEPLALALASSDAELRSYGIFALGQLGAIQQAPQVAALLVAPDPDPRVRSVAAYALGSLLRADAPLASRESPAWGTALDRGRAALEHAGTRDADEVVRWNAIVAFAHTGDPRASALLSQLIEAAAANPAGTAASAAPSVDPKRALVDRSQAIEQAVAVAVKLGDAGLVPALDKLAAATPNVALQLKARQAISRLQGPR